MKRSASAVWNGSLKTGTGSLTTPGSAFSSTPYSFNSRFASGPGTNPEEMIAAAHSGCFAMALSATLGIVPPPGWTVTAPRLILTAKVTPSATLA